VKKYIERENNHLNLEGSVGIGKKPEIAVKQSYHA
jgi:hypothetical protein